MRYLQLGLIALAGQLAAGSVAVAQEAEFDMLKVTCGEVGGGDEETAAAIWIDGYLAAKSNDTVTGAGWVEAIEAEAEAGCKNNPSKTIFALMNERRDKTGKAPAAAPDKKAPVAKE